MNKINKLITYKSINYNKTKEISKLFASRIKEEFDPKLIIFIARGGHIIASSMQEVLNIPMIDIDCSIDVIKKSDSLIVYFPEIFKKKLRIYTVLNKNPMKTFDKKISYSKRQWKLYQSVDKILIVDDTVETGKTIENILPIVNDYFKKATIKVATLSNFECSSVDYHIYDNTILAGPWGRDSKDYKRFVSDYDQYKLHKTTFLNRNNLKNIITSPFHYYHDSTHSLEKNKIYTKRKTNL